MQERYYNPTATEYEVNRFTKHKNVVFEGISNNNVAKNLNIYRTKNAAIGLKSSKYGHLGILGGIGM
jgi:hypothetical protein